MTNQQVVNFIRPRIANGVPLATICEELMTKCLAQSSHALGVGCDNMTVVIVGLLFGKPHDHLVKLCQTPSEAPPESAYGTEIYCHGTQKKISFRMY